MKQLLLFLVLMGSIVMHAQDDPPVEVPQIAIRIPLGETVQIGGIEVSFLEVLEDSRCPEDVTCIWAGRVRVKVSVKGVEEDAIIEELLFGQTRSGEKRNTTLYKYEGYELRGISVTPYPITEDQGKRNYALLVKEIKQ